MHSATNSSMKCLFLLSVLLLAVLSGCGTPAPIAQTPATNSAPTAIPPLATSAPLQATMQPTRGQTTAPSVTPIPAPLPPTGLDTSPTVIPASETPPLVVDRLPLDEPWVWIPTRACNYDSGIVIAVSRTGRVQQLQTPIVTVVERTALPPVLVTCTIDGTFALIETDYWTSRPLAIPASTRLQSFLVSPDGIHLAFNAAPDPGSIANQKYDKQLIQIVNMQTGALRTVIDTNRTRRWIL
jgi:hypothetical protein